MHTGFVVEPVEAVVVARSGARNLGLPTPLKPRDALSERVKYPCDIPPTLPSVTTRLLTALPAFAATMNDPAQDDTRERLKAALWFAVGQMVDEESMKKNRNATPQFIGALTEMVWEQIEATATDLEGFSRHAGRTTVTADDVVLLARKNPDLHELIRDYVDELKAKKASKGKGKGRQ